MAHVLDPAAATDGELVRQARRGRTDAYAQLVRRWSARVLATCRARVRRCDVAEELAQETLLRGLRALDTLEIPEKFGPWLRGIAQRVCLDWLKSKQAQQVPFAEIGRDGIPEEWLAEECDPGNRLDRAEESRLLTRAVDSLPEILRETLMLFYYHDMSYRELADLLGISTAAVNARLTRARGLLRKRLTPSDNAAPRGRLSRESDGV